MISNRIQTLLRGILAGFALITCFLSQSLYAASYLKRITDLKNGEWVFEAGGYYSRMGKSQHIDINGAVGNDFNVLDKHAYNGVLVII